MKKDVWKESETVEFKTSTTQMKKAMFSIVAILNKHQRGELYFGVEDNGNVLGQSVTQQTLRDVSEAIASHIEPRIFPKISKVVLDGKECVKVGFAGSDIPYHAYGRAYMRVSDQDKQLSIKELERLFLKKNKEKMRFDNDICPHAKLSDISVKRLKWFLKESGKDYDSLKNALDKLGLLKGEKLTNAAVILFGKRPQKFFDNAKLRCATFATERTATILDRQEFEGNLFDLIERAEEYILAHINIGMRLEGLRRIDVPEIDRDAFREAIINAFCHRDYYEYDAVQVAVFRDRLEIRSSGELYGGLTIKRIKTEMVSKRRNELIAQKFHEVHFIEKWGRGIDLILGKEPETGFKIVAGLFITSFKRKERGGISGGISGGINDLLNYIKEHPGLRANALTQAILRPKRTVERWLKELKDAGKIRFVGSKKTGGYHVIQQQSGKHSAKK